MKLTTRGGNISNLVAFFPRGFKKWKSSHDDEYGHGQKKRRASAYVEGKMGSHHKSEKGRRKSRRGRGRTGRARKGSL